MQVLRAAGYFAVPEGEPNQYREHLRTYGMSVGTYCIPVGGNDDQQQHGEDELYVVVRGRAKLLTDCGAVEVSPGSVIHVAAHDRHQFTDVSEDLSLLVVFAPPESLRT
jgi:mannose-6-phosphate isomerase-like protein (cupin superfamily)